MNKVAIEKAWKAAQMDKLADLKALVPTEISANASTCNPENHIHTLLMSACAHGSISCAQYLIEKGANISLKNCDGDSALHWAAYTGRDEMIPILLESRPEEIEARNQEGNTPLHIASFRGHTDFVRDLLDRGADVNALSSSGWTALHYAIKSNQRSVAELLIARGIDASGLDANGESIEHLAAKCKRGWFEKVCKAAE